MRIGDVLLEHGWIDGASLVRAAAEQRLAGKRICSLLIARDLLDPDHASRALGEQHGVFAALQRHLAGRDQTLVTLLPATLARATCALPIGRMRNGDLIVCVRDPSVATQQALASALKGTFVLAVAPASQLESLVELEYEPAVTGEFDVDISTTGPIVSVGVNLATRPDPIVPDDALGDLGSLSLVELDDTRVSKDPSQSGMLTLPALPKVGSAPLVAPKAPLPPPPTTALAAASQIPTAPALSLPATIAAIGAATSRDEITDLAMRYAASRWTASLLVTIKEGVALGHRGHGHQLSADAVLAVALPLALPSLIQVAFETGKPATTAPDGAIQARLLRLLGNPRWPVAVPVMVGSRIGLVLVVGDAFVTDRVSSPDVERLAAALGDGYARLVREAKK